MKAFLNSDVLGRVKLTEANSKTRAHFNYIRLLYFGLQGRIDRPDPSEKNQCRVTTIFSASIFSILEF